MAANAAAKTTGLSGYRARSLKTLQAMMHLYCEGHRHGSDERLCPRCAALLRYATRRLERCVFGDAKPNCAECRVHCYRSDMREEIRRVMRWAGPRMLLRHPILSVAHMFASRRPIPGLPERSARSAERDQAPIP
jgi:Nitrous oxide-stimulated promoter